MPGPGSSPLTRGKHAAARLQVACEGLIPAHAGKTGHKTRPLQPIGAHPRSRGENSTAVSSAAVSRGSSPLTRGKPTDLTQGAPPCGSSPLTRGKHFLTCAFIAQIDQILESLELCAFSESYSSQDVYATDAPRDRVRSIGLAPRSSRGAS